MNPFEKFTLYTMTESRSELKERMQEIQRNLSAGMGKHINEKIAEVVRAKIGLELADIGLRVRRHYDKDQRIWRAELDGESILFWTPGQFIPQESKLWLEYSLSVP